MHGPSIRIAHRKVKRERQLALILSLAVGLICPTARAAFELRALGPQAAGMGGAGAAFPGDTWSALRNPALAATACSGAGVFWSQQFELPELAREGLIVQTQVHGQPLAIRGGNFGTALYREGDLGLVLARGLSPQLEVGLELDGRWLEIEGNSTARLLAVSGGLAAHPVPGLNLGAVWQNLNEPKLPGYRDRIAESLTVGVAAEVVSGSWIAADIVQELHFPAEYRIGAEATVLPNLILRAGARAEPMRPSAGFQVVIGRWRFAYAGDLHPDLGPSHELGLEIGLNR